jgi:UDP-glucose 4-epimerase
VSLAASAGEDAKVGVLQTYVWDWRLMTNIFVAGGRYIGSHNCLDLFNKGFVPVTYDNLSNGHADFVKWGSLETGDIRDLRKLDEFLKEMAFFKSVDANFAGV